MVAKVVAGLLALVACTFAGTGSNLVSLIQIYRHGERVPVQFYPNDPYQDFKYWNTTPGQLTTNGIAQHFQLGQYTRSRYNKFIPKLYSNEDFLVQSTNTDRTFMSAASNIAGLYPPIGYQVWRKTLLWQPIPVFPVNEAVLSSSPSCNAYLEAAAEVLNSEEFVNILQDNQELLQYISEHSGLNITTFYDILLIWDALHIENIRNLPLPKWTKSVYPEPLTSLALPFYLASSYTDELKIFTSGPFINTIIEHFEFILADSSSVQKYLQFSGHDINLLNILDTLGAFQPPVPGFASTIYFELRERRGGNYINIYYSNVAGAKPVPVTVAGCSFDCSLQDFRSILANRTITTEEFYALCNV